MPISDWHCAVDSGAGSCLPTRIGRLAVGTAVAGRTWLTAAGAAGTARATRPAAAASGSARIATRPPREVARAPPEGTAPRTRDAPPRAFLPEIIDMAPPWEL